MSGVNELADKWETEASADRSTKVKRLLGDAMNYTADELRQEASRGWKAVTNPPEDTDSSEKILFYDPKVEPHIEIEPIVAYDWDCFVACVEDWEHCKWAWPSDVILMPTEET